MAVGTTTITGSRKPLGYQQITSLSSAVGLTIPAPTAANNGMVATYAVIQAEAQAVRWRDDGTNPTTSIGMTIPSGGELDYSGDLGAIKFIEVTASAKLNITYYG